MVATKRIAAFFGAVTLASALTGCGGGPQEVDAEGTEDQSQASDGGDSSTTSESETSGASDDLVDGDQVTISNITEVNAKDACEIIADSGTRDVFNAMGIEKPEGMEITYSAWNATYEKEEWNIAPTLGCHAFINEDATDGSKHQIHIWVTEQGNDWDKNDPTFVSTRSDSVQAVISVSMPDGKSAPEDEVLAQFLKDDVLPKFQP